MNKYLKIKSKDIFYLLLIVFSIKCSDSGNQVPKKPQDSLNKNISSSTEVTKPFKKFQPTCIPYHFNPNNFFNSQVSLLTGEKNHSNTTIFNHPHWEFYSEYISTSWNKLEQQRLNKIKQWREKEIATIDTLTHTIFYPFSGPDFLTAATFFPKADTFILLGLEPVGTLPDFSKMTPEKQQEYTSSFTNALSDIFDKSYFITRKMLNDFQPQKLNGLLPVLCFFIKKMDYSIADIKYIYKDSTASIKETDYFSKPSHKPFGVKITAIKDSCAKTIYYFRYNVMDKFFNDSSTFYQYISHFNNYVTYIKSASYLLHNPFMTNIRNLILHNSIAILQDDTGVPYKYLADSTKWTLKIYGEYTKPVKDFGKMGYQIDLAKKMKSDSAYIPKLPFHLGYHWGNKKDVLLFALKNKQ